MTEADSRERQVFLAFASKPTGLFELIVDAVGEYQRSGPPFDLKPWTDLNISGGLIWKKIFEEIDRRQFFIADVTTLNPNVTYELGYAIGRQRKIRLILNRDLKDDQNRDQIGIFDVLGYTAYQSREDLVRFFSQDIGQAEPIFTDEEINRSAPIFLFDAEEKTELVNHVKTSVKKLLVRFRSYDPQEQARLPVHEAIKQVASSEGVVVTFVPESYQNSEQHNLRASFISGLSHGLDKCLAIVQIGDMQVPLDFREFTDQCFSKDHIEKAIERFTLSVSPRLQMSVHKTRSTHRSILELLDLGGSVAENEMQVIDDYYLDTDAFLRASRGEVRLIVGRKGSGKTALFVHLRNEKRKPRRNVVVDLKPEGFKLLKFKERIVDALSEGSLTHVVSAIWEYVILLELAYKLLESDKHVHVRDMKLAAKYESLREIYEQDEYYSEGDFSERVSVLLDEISRKIQEQLGSNSSVILSQRQVSELIYKHPIHELRQQVADYLAEKGETWVLIDNLDKGWPSTGVTKGDVSLILCLLEALEKTSRAFRQKGYDNFYSTVFLRADVYDNLVDATADRGKVIPTSVDWSDSGALKELLRKRFVYSDFDDELSIDHIWEQVVEPKISGKNSLDTLINQSLFRPRALLDLISAARSIAVNRRHRVIGESDMVEAIRRSSFQMIENINLELRDVSPEFDQLLERLIYRFGCADFRAIGL